MEKYKIIGSLHRPLHIPLKTTKWVCLFVAQNNKQGKITKPSSFYTDFFFYLINVLHKEYKKDFVGKYFTDGIPTRDTINEIYNYFILYKAENKKEQLKFLLSIKREKGSETQIYSTYKAISYYINLAKDKFGLLDNKYELSEHGLILMKFRSPYFKLTQQEKSIYFERILFCDIHAFISLCLLKKHIIKYSLTPHEILFGFLNRYYKEQGSRLDYNANDSLRNYTNVRLSWIEQLNILDNNNNIRQTYKSIIAKSSENYSIYEDIYSNLNIYIKDEFRKLSGYKKNKKTFNDAYNLHLKLAPSEEGYINLYDLKASIKMSHSKFESFLNEFYEKEKNNYSIFFSNIVTSIDKRKRFYVRNTPIIKIKMTGNGIK